LERENRHLANFRFAAIQGVSNSFEMPTLSALVPELVKREEIQSAISIDRSVFHGSRVLDPPSVVIWSRLGAWLGVFCECNLVYCSDRRHSFIAARLQGTKEEEEKRMSGIKKIRYVASDKPSLAMMFSLPRNRFVFSDHHRDDAAYVRLVLHLARTNWAL